MSRLKQKAHAKEPDLLKIYRKAYERSKYLYDIDDKLANFQKVLDFCSSSKICTNTNSVKRNQVLFWTYNQLGDLFCQKKDFLTKRDDYLLGAEYFKRALEFANSSAEKSRTLEKLARVYYYLKDDALYQNTLERIAALLDDADQKEILYHLTQNTNDMRRQASYLEEAIRLLDKEDIHFLKNCQRKMIICDKLLKIYDKLNAKVDMARTEEIKTQTQKMLQ